MSDAAVNDMSMINADSTGVLGALKVLSGKIEEIKRPSGQDRKSPARTCLDLFLAAQENGETLDNGHYWVDPNQGCEADAIEVYCKFDSFADRVETCVHATESKIAKKSHQSGWWSETNGMPFAYDPAKDARVPRADYASQITFLRLLASQASQTVKLHCNGGTTEGLKIRGTGTSEFDVNHKDFKITRDGCSGRSGWNHATVEVVTKATARMPIRDLHVADNGDAFGFDVGPICFS